LSSSSLLRDAADKTAASTEEPLGLVRLVVGTIALLGTLVAAALALTGVEPRAIELIGALWAIYGLTVGLVSGVLEPVVDGLSRAFTDAGLLRAGGGYSAIETLEAQGHLAEAAESYAERARNRPERVEATLRRAVLLAGPLSQPEIAAAELGNLRTASPLSERDDLRVGLALIDLYEHGLQDPGRAMAELRRLLDRYPAGSGARRLRAALSALKSQRFGNSDRS
jgi:hypothetical protein